MLKSEQVSLDVPAQIIDGILYVPAKSIYAAGIKLHTNSYPTNDYWVMWRNGRQVLLLEYGVTATYQSANKNAIITTGVVNDADIQDSDTNKLPYTARTLRGELMIPVYNVQNDTGIQILFAKGKNYDANEKSLYISINVPSRPSS